MIDIEKRTLQLQITHSIAYHPIYSLLTNDLASGILLSYLSVEWWARDKELNPSSIMLTDTKLMNLLMMNQDQLNRSMGQILKLGVIQTFLSSKPGQFSYNLCEHRLEEILVQYSNTAESVSQNPDFGQIFPINCVNTRSIISSSLRSREEEDDIIEISSRECKNQNTQGLKPRTIELNSSSSSPSPLREEEDDDRIDLNTSTIPKLTKAEKVQFIFDFWNEFKGSSKPGTTVRWQSHNKLTEPIEKAILQVLGEAADLEEESHLEVCHAIENYARILLSEETYYSHVWPLQTFLTVHETNKSTSMKKWQKFLNTNFVYDSYLTTRPIVLPKHDEALCKAIIRRYGKSINNPQFKAQGSELTQFAACAVLAKTVYTRYHLSSSECLDYFFQMLEEEFTEKGQAILPGHLASHRLWEARFPQFLSSQGL